eukprot:TRINITY_DN2040_c2_g1_i1.p1 TRINITY_DN2040_c2_g1~~TRINITY_DN2040_c2_g1_i1.p1  ORF type:complete len:857 (+),score=287.73 TRINITY_DN2040_c2_g1_i1:48-2573(+)
MSVVVLDSPVSGGRSSLVRRSTQQRSRSVKFGSEDDRASERLRRMRMCLDNFSDWDGCCGFVELLDVQQAVVSFGLLQSRKRRFLSHWRQLVSKGRVPLEMGPDECTSAVCLLTEDLLSDEFDAFIEHMSRVAGVIESAIGNPELLRKRRVLVNLFQRWDKSGSGLLPLDTVLALLRRQQLLPPDLQDCQNPSQHPVLLTAEQPAKVARDARDPHVTVPEGQLDLLRFVALMHFVLDEFETEAAWHAAARRVFVRVGAEVSTYAGIAVAYAGVAEQLRKEVEEAESAVRHAFDGITEQDCADFAKIGAPPPWMEVCCTPAAYLLGLVPDEDADGRETACRPLQALLSAHTQALIGPSGLMRRYPLHCITYKLIRTLVDEVSHEVFDPVRLFAEHKVVAALTGWATHLLRAVCLENSWDFSDVPVYASHPTQTAEKFPLLRGVRPPSGKREGLSLERDGCVSDSRGAAAGRSPRPPGGNVLPANRLRSRIGPVCNAMPSTQRGMSLQEVGRMALSGRRGGRRPRGSSPHDFRSAAPLVPQPPRSTHAAPLAGSSRGSGGTKHRPTILMSPRAASTAGLVVEAAPGFQPVAAFRSPGSGPKSPGFEVALSPPPRSSGAGAKEEEEREPTEAAAAAAEPAAAEPAAAEPGPPAAKADAPPAKTEEQLRQEEERQEARRQVSAELREMAIREFEEEERWLCEAARASEGQCKAVTDAEYAAYVAAHGSDKSAASAQRLAEAEEVRKKQDRSRLLTKLGKLEQADELSARRDITMDQADAWGKIRSAAAESRQWAKRGEAAAAAELSKKLLERRRVLDDDAADVKAARECLSNVEARLEQQKNVGK